jgi:hypothetical protein
MLLPIANKSRKIAPATLFISALGVVGRLHFSFRMSNPAVQQKEEK